MAAGYLVGKLLNCRWQACRCTVFVVINIIGKDTTQHKKQLSSNPHFTNPPDICIFITIMESLFLQGLEIYPRVNFRQNNGISQSKPTCQYAHAQILILCRESPSMKISKSPIYLLSFYPYGVNYYVCIMLSLPKDVQEQLFIFRLGIKIHK